MSSRNDGRQFDGAIRTRGADNTLAIAIARTTLYETLEARDIRENQEGQQGVPFRGAEY